MKALKYRAWIKRHPCHMCGKWDDVTLDGSPHVTPSHIRTYGSTGQDYNNIVPMCWECHQEFEQWPREKKRKLLKIAQEYTSRYLEERET